MGHRALFAIEHNNATGRVSYWEGTTHHSAADRNGISLADYIHAMYGLLRQAKARDVLMIGCGGGTLATMLTRAGVRVTMVEIDPASIDVARRYFHLPDSVVCHIGDGARFLRRDARRYDAIVLDAYTQSGIPRQFRRKAFFAAARARLRRSGILLVNVIVADDDDPLPFDLAAPMRTSFRQVRLLDSPDYTDRNAVLMAGTVKALRLPRLLLKPARAARKLAQSMKTFAFREI
ncbi:MAG: fused MFS/spermidine synthase [Proteobacteria bacterium]|nr:fused MFS/spermidine synthase [Pseudomonadota bacterium]